MSGNTFFFGIFKLYSWIVPESPESGILWTPLHLPAQVLGLAFQ